MRLALITQDFPPDIGGIQTYSFEIANRIYKNCEDFYVIAPQKEGSEAVDSNLPFDVYRIAVSNPLLGLKGIPEVLPILKKRGTTHTFHAQWQSLTLSMLAKKTGLIKYTAVAAHARELLFDPFKVIPSVYDWYKKKLLQQVDQFFPVSEYTATLLQQYEVEQSLISVVINGTDPDQFYPTDIRDARNSLGLNNDVKVLLTITRLVSRKGVDTTLKAFKNVLQFYPNSIYVIVGDGEYKAQLEQLSKQLDISDNVLFTGRVPYAELLTYYNGCDVFAMPSKNESPDVEGFGIVFLEANACAKPVIGTYSGGIPSAIINGETGLLVEEQNPEELAKAIRKLFSDESYRKELGRKGRLRVEKEANWNAVAQKIYMLLNNLED